MEKAAEKRALRGTPIGGFGLVAAFAVALVLMLAPTWAAGAADRREVEGRALFFKGEYQHALDIYATLFAETGDPLYLRNIGRCYQKLQQPDKAIDSFREYLRRGRKIKPAEREEIATFVKEMEALKSKQETESAPVASRPPERAGPSRGTDPPVATKEPVANTAAIAAPVTPLRRAARGAPEGSTMSVRSDDPKPSAELSAKLTEPPPDPETDDSEGLTRKWWFWTGIGALVIGGVVTATLLSRGGGASEPVCPANATCPR